MTEADVGGVSVRALTGASIEAALPALARLRILVFADFPYLYDGDETYERAYLAAMAAAEGSVVVGAFDGERLVGAATGGPMAAQHAEFSDPMRAAGYDPATVFYCGESVLDPRYRGRGIGHAFFDGREAQAKALGLSTVCFCGVIRPLDHPKRPPTYAPLDPFWRKRGYAPLSGVLAHFSWRDLGDAEETEKPLQFWARALD